MSASAENMPAVTQNRDAKSFRALSRPVASEEIAAYQEDGAAVIRGDVIVHHPLAIHFSNGNRSARLRRRALALRYLGDDACFDARPGTFMENAKVRALFASDDLLRFEDGQPMINAAFPVVWPPED